MKDKTHKFNRASNLLSPHIPWSPEGLPSHLSPHHPIKNITTSGLLLPFSKWILIIGIIYISMFASVSFAQANANANDSLVVKKPHWDRDLKFSSEIDKTSLPQNDTLEFRAIVELQGNPLEYHFDEIEAPKVSNLDLVISSSSNKTEVIDGVNHYYRVYSFRYLPKTMGMAYINPATLNLEHIPSGQVKVLRTSRLEVDVQEPILPKDYSKLLMIAIIVLGLIIIAFVIYFLIIKRKPNDDEVQEEIIPLETQYITKLKAQKELLQKGDLQGFFNQLPTIMREYLGKKFGFAAKGMSTMELISELESAGMGGKDLEALQKSFDICDRVRFARENVGDNAAQEVFAGFEKILASFEPKNDKES